MMTSRLLIFVNVELFQLFLIYFCRKLEFEFNTLFLFISFNEWKHFALVSQISWKILHLLNHYLGYGHKQDPSGPFLGPKTLSGPIWLVSCFYKQHPSLEELFCCRKIINFKNKKIKHQSHEGPTPTDSAKIIT